MKNFSAILFIALAFVTFSCNKVDDLKKINIDTDVQHNASIVIKTPSGKLEPKTAFDIGEKIKLSANGDFSKYPNDKINSLTIKSVKLVFSGYTGDKSGELEGKISIDGLANIAADITKFNVKNASDNKTEIVVPFTEGELSTIASSLKSSKELGISFKGTAYNAPMSFNLDYKVEVGAEIQVVK